MKSSFGWLWTVWVTSLGDWSQSIAWHLTPAVVKHRSASSIINFYPRANAKRTYFSFCLLLPFQLSGTAGVKNESAALKKGCATVSFLKLTALCCPQSWEGLSLVPPVAILTKEDTLPPPKATVILKWQVETGLRVARGNSFTPKTVKYYGTRNSSRVYSFKKKKEKKNGKMDFSVWALIKRVIFNVREPATSQDDKAMPRLVNFF